MHTYIHTTIQVYIHTYATVGGAAQSPRPLRDHRGRRPEADAVFLGRPEIPRRVRVPHIHQAAPGRAGRAHQPPRHGMYVCMCVCVYAGEYIWSACMYVCMYI